MKIMKISSKKHGDFNVLLDDEDFDWVKNYKWNICKRKTHIRIQRSWWENGGTKTVFLHREIIKPPQNKEIDHINGNGLDNRKENLRVVNHNQNLRNVNKYSVKKSSVYKGVFPRGKKWCAAIRVNWRLHWLGSFNTEIEAAKAYNEASLKYHGEYGRLNAFPA